MLCHIKGVFAFLFLFSLSLFATETAVVADKIEFDQNGMATSGNSEIVYKKFTLYSGSFTYNRQSKKILIPNHYQIRRDDLVLKADNFNYDMGTRAGQTRNLCLDSDQIHLTGKKVDVFSDRIVFHGATFTTCDTSKAHYLISSERMTLYPLLGFIWFYSNRISLPFFPFPIYVPTYFYGAGSSVVGSSFPEIGSSKREGFYIKQRFPYFFTGHAKGSLDIGYLQKLGLYYGSQFEYLLNKNQNIYASAHNVGSDGFSGGVTYSYTWLKNEIENEDESLLSEALDTFSASESKKQATLTVRHRIQDLTNRSLVDHVPEISYKKYKHHIKKVGLDHEGSLSVAKVRELTEDDKTISHLRLVFDFTLSKDIRLGKKFVFNPYIRNASHWHKDVQNWHRQFLGFRVRYEQSFLNPQLSYVKVFSEGRSPFSYIHDYDQQNDELQLKLSQEFMSYKVAADFAYDIEEDRTRYLNVVFSFIRDCVSFDLGYRIHDERFTFGVNL